MVITETGVGHGVLDSATPLTGERVVLQAQDLDRSELTELPRNRP